MGGQKASHESCPLLRPQHLSEDRKAWQKKTFEVVVNKSRVDRHAMRLNANGTGAGVRIAEMGGECILEALKLRKRRRHCLD